MLRINRLLLMVCLLIISFSARTATIKAAPKKEKEPTSDSKKSVSSDTTKTATKKDEDAISDSVKPSSERKRVIKDILKSAEDGVLADYKKLVSKDTAKSPYELMKAQKKDVIPLLIARPTTKYGVSKLEDKWILHLCETYMHFRLGGIPTLSIVSPDTLSELLTEYKVYEQAVSNKVYEKTAKKLSVPYLLYLQCEYIPLVKGVNFLGVVSSVIDGKSISNYSGQFPLKEFGATLDHFANQIVEDMGIEPAKQNSPFLKSPLMSKKVKNIKKLGSFLSSIDKLDEKSWKKFIKKYNNLLNKDPELLVGYYAGAKFCGAAKKYAEAAEFSQALVKKLGEKYPRAYLMSTRFYRLAKNFDEAIRVADLAKNLKGIQVPLRVEMVQCYSEKGDFEQSLTYFEEVLKKNPKNVQAIEMSAEIYDKNGDLEKAVAMYQKYLALPKTKKHKNYDFRIAELYEKQEKQKLAITHYSKNIESYPDDIRNYIALGRIYLEKKSFTSAQEILEKAVVLPGEAPAISEMLAEAYIGKKDTSAAIQHYRNYLQSSPNDFDVWVLLANFYFSKGRYKETIESFESARNLVDENHDYRYKLGVSYYELGEYDKAERYLFEAHEREKANTTILKMLASCYRSLNDERKLNYTMNILAPPEEEEIEVAPEPEELPIEEEEVPPVQSEEPPAEESSVAPPVQPEEPAAEEVSVAPPVQPEEPAAEEISIALPVQPGVSAAEKVSIPPSTQPKAYVEKKRAPNPMVEKGKKLVLQKRYKGAIDLFMQLLVSGESSTEMLFWMFRAYSFSGKFYEGEKIFLNNLNKPNEVWSLITLGEINELKALPDEALALYKRAYEADPQNQFAISGIGRIELYKGNYESALEYLGKSFAFSQDNPQYCLDMGKCYEGMDRYDEALAHYEEVLSKSEEFPEAFDCVGRIYIKKGLHSKAVEVYNKGIASYPNYGMFYLGLGICSKIAGETDKAIAFFQKALKKGKKSKTFEAYRYLGEIYYQRDKGKKNAEKFLKKYLKAGGNREIVVKIRAAAAQKKAKKEQRKAAKKQKVETEVKEVKEEVSTTPQSPSIADELKKYAELRDAGIISEEEFQELKKKLLSQ